MSTGFIARSSQMVKTPWHTFSADAILKELPLDSRDVQSQLLRPGQWILAFVAGGLMIVAVETWKAIIRYRQGPEYAEPETKR